MIPAADNSMAGSQLDTIYIHGRVINGDAFFVTSTERRAVGSVRSRQPPPALRCRKATGS